MTGELVPTIVYYQNFFQSTRRFSAQNVKYQFKAGVAPSTGRTIAGLLVALD